MWRRYHYFNAIRSFPELANLTDAECRRLKLSWAVRGGKTVWPSIVALAAGVAWGLWLFEFFEVSGLRDAIDNAKLLESWHRFVLLLLIFWGGGLTAGVIVYRVMQYKMLRTIAATHVRERRCLFCDYSLIGLPVLNGMIRCPECGEHSEARLLGVRLMSEPLAESSSAGRR